jgi:hypothetical protein
MILHCLLQNVEEELFRIYLLSFTVVYGRKASSILARIMYF